MKKTGLQIIEAIAKGEAPNRIKTNDGIFIYDYENKYYRNEDLRKTPLFLMENLNKKITIVEDSADEKEYTKVSGYIKNGKNLYIYIKKSHNKGKLKKQLLYLENAYKNDRNIVPPTIDIKKKYIVICFTLFNKEDLKEEIELYKEIEGEDK